MVIVIAKFQMFISLNLLGLVLDLIVTLRYNNYSKFDI